MQQLLLGELFEPNYSATESVRLSVAVDFQPQLLSLASIFLLYSQSNLKFSEVKGHNALILLRIGSLQQAKLYAQFSFKVETTLEKL